MLAHSQLFSIACLNVARSYKEKAMCVCVCYVVRVGRSLFVCVCIIVIVLCVGGHYVYVQGYSVNVIIPSAITHAMSYALDPASSVSCHA